MQIQQIRWKNFNSYGNKWNEIDFTHSDSSYSLILGGNGCGKCLNPNTEIDIEMNSLLKDKFKKFLEDFPKPLDI